MRRPSGMFCSGWDTPEVTVHVNGTVIFKKFGAIASFIIYGKQLGQVTRECRGRNFKE
jgi:hypothetical protein